MDELQSIYIGVVICGKKRGDEMLNIEISSHDNKQKAWVWVRRRRAELEQESWSCLPFQIDVRKVNVKRLAITDNGSSSKK